MRIGGMMGPGLLVVALGLAVTAPSAEAQQIRGTPGAPSAVITPR